MIAATATFAVLKRETSPKVVQVVTILTDLADIQPCDVTLPPLLTYTEAVHVATERGMNRDPRIGFLRGLGLARFVAITERIAFSTEDELDAMVTAIT